MSDLEITTESLASAVEKIFRYFVPGFLFVILFRLAFPSKTILSMMGKVEFAAFLPCLGMVIYGLHRLIYWVLIDYLIFKFNGSATSLENKSYPVSIGLFFQKRQNEEKFPLKLSQYLHYRYSIIHYCLIFSELLFFFLMFHEQNSFLNKHKYVLWFVCSIVFVTSLVHYIQLSLAEKELFK